ncbi:ATPases involved in chromosome partitioning [Methanocella conradii HZ254]|uniref:Iron-sulfur cluster carrier protein n=1 Tax=Methanocella conradii (strain DSM 24694 / JCM 17849 / CGMCC 1.5162 / HZ254) TaxID=1041930 RepID=H8I4B4_METCZ|nr:Mrp/NBP35 family ATP-binding protein [Methanocella conradii]AFC99671.1 ATPases involved in chromosome partitioning [Methanocella conradii HZ254]
MSSATKSSACESCANRTDACKPETCGHAEKNEQEMRIKANMGRIKNRIAIVSGKGGVGKSTVTAGIAIELARNGFKVGVLDADVSGPNMPHLLGVENKRMEADENSFLPVEAAHGIKVVSVEFLISSSDSLVIWRGPLRSSLINQFLADVAWGDLDFLLVDLPPGTGDEPLSIMQTLPLTGLIVVSTPSNLSILDVSKIVNMAKMLNTRIIGVVENMAYYECPTCGEKVYPFGEDTVKRLCERYGLTLLGSIPIDPANRGTDIMVSSEGSLSKGTGDIAHKLICMLG